MTLYVEGDKSKAFCTRCSDIVKTTFFLRNVPFSDGRGIAMTIIAGVCDNCKSVVAIPAQSVPAIAQSRTSDVMLGQARN